MTGKSTTSDSCGLTTLSAGSSVREVDEWIDYVFVCVFLFFKKTEVLFKEFSTNVPHLIFLYPWLEFLPN